MHTLKSLVLIAAFAAATALGCDLLFARLVSMPPKEYETVDAIADYVGSDPDTLVLGSSYARSFEQIAHELAQVHAPSRLAIVPIEGGKFFAYDWLVRHRFAELIDERDGSGKLVRPSLKRFILVTNYWDICDSAEPYPNLPARAWALSDYLEDVSAHGVTAYNNNYLDQRFAELSEWSMLTRDRGIGRILRTLREKAKPKTEAEARETEAIKLEQWLEMIEANDMSNPALCSTAQQSAALGRMMAFAKERKLEVTFVLWTLIPKSQTPRTVRITDQFKRYIEGVAARHDARVVDFQAGAPLQDQDFRKDLDHLEPWGNDKLGHWALSGPMSFLSHKAGH